MASQGRIWKEVAMAVKTQRMLEKRERQERHRSRQKYGPVTVKAQGTYECPLTGKREAEAAHLFRTRMVRAFCSGSHPVEAIRQASQEVRSLLFPGQYYHMPALYYAGLNS
jgi:hypothetical protein